MFTKKFLSLAICVGLGFSPLANAQDQKIKLSDMDRFQRIKTIALQCPGIMGCSFVGTAFGGLLGLIARKPDLGAAGGFALGFGTSLGLAADILDQQIEYNTTLPTIDLVSGALVGTGLSLTALTALLATLSATLYVLGVE